MPRLSAHAGGELAEVQFEFGPLFRGRIEDVEAFDKTQGFELLDVDGALLLFESAQLGKLFVRGEEGLFAYGVSVFIEDFTDPKFAGTSPTS